MIVGGQSDNPSKTEDKAYALSLDSSINVPACLENICDFPHYVRHATTGIFEDGLPTVCGGYEGHYTSPAFFNECYKYNFTNAWDYASTKNYAQLAQGQ